MKGLFTKIIAIALTIFTVGCNKNNAGTSTSISDENVIETGSQNYYLCYNSNLYDSGMIFGEYDGVKRYLDFETMNETTLCTLPNCNHNTTDCVAIIISNTPIIYNDYIYYFFVKHGVKENEDNREFWIESTLKRFSLSTSEIEDVVQFTDCEPNDENGCELIGSMLYFCADDMNPTENEYGTLTYANAGGTHYLCSINLETGEYKNYGSIYDGAKQYEGASCSSSAKITGLYDSKIYIEYSFMKDSYYDVDKDADARDIFTVMNFEFDLSSEKITESNLPSACYMNENVYLCSNYPENSSTLILNGDEIVINNLDVVTSGIYYNNKIFIGDNWYDITDGSEHDLGDYENWHVVAYYDDCYIIANMTTTDFVKLTEEELLAL